MKDFYIIIDKVLKELGYEIVELNGKELYYHADSYYKFTYIDDFQAYIIEYANGYEEAKNNIFEDGDIFPIALDEIDFINKLKSDMIKYYL